MPRGSLGGSWYVAYDLCSSVKGAELLCGMLRARLEAAHYEGVAAGEKAVDACMVFGRPFVTRPSIILSLRVSMYES